MGVKVGVIDVDGLDSWFTTRLSTLSGSDTLKAYVAGVLKGYVSTVHNPLTTSIVMEFAAAHAKGDFVALQRVGDSVLWIGAVLPARFKIYASTYETLGRFSYNACHRMLRGSWPVYEELADELPRIIKTTRSVLSEPHLSVNDNDTVVHSNPWMGTKVRTKLESC